MGFGCAHKNIEISCKHKSRAWLGVKPFESLRGLKRGQFDHFMCWKFHARVARVCLVPMLGYNSTIVQKYWYQSKVCLVPVLITIWYKCQVITYNGTIVFFMDIWVSFGLKQLVNKAFSISQSSMKNIAIHYFSSMIYFLRLF